MECSRRFHTKRAFKMLNICEQIHSWDLQDVKEKLYRTILTSPEMCLGDGGFAALKEPRWSGSILFMVVDEADCIKHWGGEFRKHYASLETLRWFVPQGVLVLATFATMPPRALENVRSILGINAERSFHLNLWNDRHNIVPVIWPMEGGVSNLAAPDFIVRRRDQPLWTSIYFKDKLVLPHAHAITSERCSPFRRSVRLIYSMQAMDHKQRR